MAEIVNLRNARKARDRAAGKARAEANRARHGQSKGQREAIKADLARGKRSLEGAWRDPARDPADREGGT